MFVAQVKMKLIGQLVLNTLVYRFPSSDVTVTAMLLSIDLIPR